MNALISALVFAVMVAVEQALPISNNTIPVLSYEAQNGVTEVYQGVILLEIVTGEKYDAPYLGCYTRFEPTNDADINTLKDDVKSFNQLLPIIQDLANNETNQTIVADYVKIIASINTSIAALNKLIIALQNNDNSGDAELHSDSGESSIEATQTDPSAGDKTDTDAQSETDHCAQLDKAAKLHALKNQAILTDQDILLVTAKHQTV